VERDRREIRAGKWARVIWRGIGRWVVAFGDKWLFGAPGRRLFEWLTVGLIAGIVILLVARWPR
jgi:hypothetical protein